MGALVKHDAKLRPMSRVARKKYYFGKVKRIKAYAGISDGELTFLYNPDSSTHGMLSVYVDKQSAIDSCLHKKVVPVEINVKEKSR